MGAVTDDGVAYRMTPVRYHLPTTTGALDRVYADMMFGNAQRRLDVDMINATSTFLGINITESKARQVVQEC